MPDLEIYEWFGLVGPAGMPPEAVRRIHAETIRFLQRPDVKARLVDQGVETIEQTPDQFRDFIRQEIERYRDIIVRANIQAQ